MSAKVGELVFAKKQEGIKQVEDRHVNSQSL
jgi:hypothetical protein